MGTYVCVYTYECTERSSGMAWCSSWTCLASPRLPWPFIQQGGRVQMEGACGGARVQVRAPASESTNSPEMPAVDVDTMAVSGFE